MWENIVEWGRPQMAIWRMRIACWIPKATNTHSEYVTLIASHYNSGCTNAPQCSHCVSCYKDVLLGRRLMLPERIELRDSTCEAAACAWSAAWLSKRLGAAIAQSV